MSVTSAGPSAQEKPMERAKSGHPLIRIQQFDAKNPLDFPARFLLNSNTTRRRRSHEGPGVGFPHPDPGWEVFPEEPDELQANWRTACHN